MVFAQISTLHLRQEPKKMLAFRWLCRWMRGRKDKVATSKAASDAKKCLHTEQLRSLASFAIDL